MNKWIVIPVSIINIYDYDYDYDYYYKITYDTWRISLKVFKIFQPISLDLKCYNTPIFNQNVMSSSWFQENGQNRIC